MHTPSGDHLSRISEMLRMARDLAQRSGDAYGPHVQDALANLEDVASDQLALLDRAREDDLADAEASGEAERRRLAWHPLRAA
jgi:hypothetical protein